MKEIIKFEDTSSDLRQSSEQWRSDDLKSRRERIYAKFKEANDCNPRPTMKIFRVGTINITKKTMIEDLILLSDKIRSEFQFDCFQIAINRKKNQAQFLFDCFDYVNLVAFRIHINNLSKLYTLIISTLKLHVKPSEMEPLLRHFLVRYYQEDHKIFAKRLDHLKHFGLRTEEYEMEYIIHNYVEAVCRGRLK